MTKTLIICLAGYPGPFSEPRLLGQDKRAFHLPMRNTPLSGEIFWRELSCGALSAVKKTGLSLGLVNYPSALPENANPILFVPCSLFGAPNKAALPLELRYDLADYLDGHERQKQAQHFKDPEQTFAEQAAAARIIREHVIRLGCQHKPDLQIVGFGGLMVIGQTKGLVGDYSQWYVRQILAHGKAMLAQLGAHNLVLIGDDRASSSPPVLIYGPMTRHMENSKGFTVNQLWRLIAETAAS